MPKQVDKPIRLYILTVFVVVAYGLFPLVSAFPFNGGYWLVGPIFLPFNGSVQVLYDTNGEVSLILLVATIALSFLTAGSAIVAFLGISEGRTAALIFATLNVVWWSFIVITAIVNNQDRTGLVISSIPELVVPPVWLGFVWWNFTRPDISAYFKYRSEVDA